MYVYIYKDIHIHTIHRHTNKNKQTNKQPRTQTSRQAIKQTTNKTNTQSYKHTHAHMHAYILAYIPTYLHICKHTYRHTYTHTYTHTYIHTSIHVPDFWFASAINMHLFMHVSLLLADALDERTERASIPTSAPGKWYSELSSSQAAPRSTMYFQGVADIVLPF